MIFRKEKPDDVGHIEKLTLGAFRNHPHHAAGQEPTEHLIVNKLREDKALKLSLVAEVNSEIIGHISYSAVCIDKKASKWLVLAPISVNPLHQSKGIGSRLILESLNIIKKQDIEGIVVLGESAFYSRFGFNLDHELKAEGASAEYFLALNFGRYKRPSGLVSFHPAFN